MPRRAIYVDSMYPYFGLAPEHPNLSRDPLADFSVEELADWMEVSKRFEDWQKKLDQMRKENRK